MAMRAVLFSSTLFFWLSSFSFASALSVEQMNPFDPVFCLELSEKGNPYEQPFREKSFEDAFAQVRTEYHQKINTLFNENIAKIGGTTLKDDETALRTANETRLEVFAQTLFSEYDQYACALRTQRRTISIENDEEIPLFYKSSQALRVLENSVDGEISRAEAALFITIRMYTEMRLYYPLHKRLESIIDPSLLKYRDVVREFVDEVFRFAAKVVNFGSKNPVQ
jgi:hypothetical protein